MSDIELKRGTTYSATMYIGQGETSLMPAQFVPGSPAKLIVSAGHGLPQVWHVIIEDHRHLPKKQYRVEAEDDQTLVVTGLNASDLKAGPVVLRYGKPADLDGFSAEMSVFDKATGTELLNLSSATTDEDESRLVIDVEQHTITRIIPASKTALITWKSACFWVEMTSGNYVREIDYGTIKASQPGCK